MTTRLCHSRQLYWKSNLQVFQAIIAANISCLYCSLHIPYTSIFIMWVVNYRTSSTELYCSHKRHCSSKNSIYCNRTDKTRYKGIICMIHCSNNKKSKTCLTCWSTGINPQHLSDNIYILQTQLWWVLPTAPFQDYYIHQLWSKICKK